jgi:hypothetical protein
MPPMTAGSVHTSRPALQKCTSRKRTVDTTDGAFPHCGYPPIQKSIKLTTENGEQHEEGCTHPGYRSRPRANDNHEVGFLQIL